jgi:hypothetical protein
MNRRTPRNAKPSALIEPLEQRSLLSASPQLLVSFYGLGGAGGFGNDWLDNITGKAGDATGSTVKKYDEDQGGRALKDTLHSIDRNHDRIISSSEAKATTLRVIGYSFGGIQAANFAQYFRKVGHTIKGYTLKAAVQIKALVTLDPVQSVLKHTSGVPSNVLKFSNYYQQKGGDTKVSLYTDPLNIKVTSISVPDPSNIKGGSLKTSAKTSNQIRVDVAPYAEESVKHKVQSHVNGKIKGKDVNHGTLPFYAYDWAVEDLTA